MDSPGGDMSADSSDTSTAVSSSNKSSAAHTPNPHADDFISLSTEHLAADNESDSDVSMSTDSADEEEDNELIDPIKKIKPDIQPLPTSNSTREKTRKRSLSSSSQSRDNQPHNGTIKDRKRLRVDDEHKNLLLSPTRVMAEDKSRLPAEVWHNIFSHCPPRTLGLLLQVNKSFHDYLDPSSVNKSLVAVNGSHLKILSADEIWRASRKNYLRLALAPLVGKTELDMWRIACGSLCQYCGEKRSLDSNVPQDQWHPGPGQNGVGPVWPFGIRTCGSCLKDHSVKEIDLLLSSTIPSPLMAALSFVFLTNELHVIAPTTLQTSSHPPSMQITKHFFIKQVEDIKQEFEQVKALGSATAEEWLKGLDGLGKTRRNDAARWERLEVGGGLSRMRDFKSHGSPPLLTRIANPLPAKVQGLPSVNGNMPTIFTPQPYQTQQGPPVKYQPQTNYSTQPPPRFESPAQNGFSQYPPRTYPPSKHERTKEEVADLKAARRAEIERRCMLLDPPLTAGVLAHMTSFQAAIQIIQPLTDSAWELLKPRLLSQREEAEQRESERLAQTRVVQERSDNRHIDTQSRSDPKDLLDREWEEIQAPLRARIGGYADETIRDGWNGGNKVSYDTSPQFAADVLIYVRKRFYAEVAKDDAALRATGREPVQDPPSGPYTRKLILENMKWVFDTKIKPLTEPHRKELFLCNACEFITKYYGFEGVIQHYAAKHTSALSMGSIVVHWKSEWPEYPPFNPDPTSAKTVYAAVPSASIPYPSSVTPQLQQNFTYGGYQQTPVPPPGQGSNLHGYMESPAPYYGHPQFEQYSGHQNGPYPPPPQPQYINVSQPYQAPQYSVAPPQNNMIGYNEPVIEYPQQTYDGQYTAPIQTPYAQQGPVYPTSYHEAPPQPTAYAVQTSQYIQPSEPPVSYSNDTNNQPSAQPTEEYRAQLQELARDAREIWGSMYGVKDVPGSVKVYTIIYHVLKRFRAAFQEDPPLSMFVDGLSNNKDMRPVRNVNGLVCRACTLGMPGSKPGSNRKHFSFPQLVNHFQSAHVEGISANSNNSVPDWTKYLVELPDASKLASVASARDMDNEKLGLFSEALPEITAVPLLTERGNRVPNTYTPEQSSHVELAPSQDNHGSYYNTSAQRTSDTVHDSGEYDPRNPRDSLIENRPPQVSSYSNGISQNGFPSDGRLPQRYPRSEDGRYPIDHKQPDEQRLLHASPRRSNSDDRGRLIIREDANSYRDWPVRYRASDDVEYRVRVERPLLVYDEPHTLHSSRDRHENLQAYQSSHEPIPIMRAQDHTFRDGRVLETSSQQNRVFEIAAQIGQEAKEVRLRQNAGVEVDVGSEDGEVRTDSVYRPVSSQRPLEDSNKAAERFLNDFLPGEPRVGSKKSAGYEQREIPRWESERSRVFQPEEARLRDDYKEDRAIPARLIEHDRLDYGRRDTAPLRQSGTFAYEDRYVDSLQQPSQKERSPELVDRRFKLNNVVYRDERQNSTHRTPSRYARYESVRLENDRARSRSPVYVKMGPQPGQYRERTPGIPHQEPVYRPRTPQQAIEDVSYDRAPRQEYYRVYADEPRPREAQYELVRVSDPNGDYMIRQPILRQAEPVYARYEDEGYSRQPVYESRGPAPKPNGAVYEEEYDPRHPEPLPPAPVNQVRYQ